MGESGKGNGKVRVGDNVLHVNLLPYLAEAYTQLLLFILTPWLYLDLVSYFGCSFHLPLKVCNKM